MDDKTLSALTALATKLGTTAEYLWGVLLKQAAVSGATSLAILLAWTAAAVLLARFVRLNTKCPAATKEDKYPSANWDGEQERFAWLAVASLSVMVAVIGSCEIGNIVAALFNPEYWALSQILK